MNMEDVQAFAAYLQTAEASGATVEKYRREAARFCVWLSGREVSRELASAYKTAVAGERSAAGINGAVAALNALFAFLDRGECRLKSVRVQRPAFRDESRELTEGEYRRLLAAARGREKERLPPGVGGRRLLLCSKNPHAAPPFGNSMPCSHGCYAKFLWILAPFSPKISEKKIDCPAQSCYTVKRGHSSC